MTMQKYLLRANALYIGIAAIAGLLFDVRGIVFGTGPQGRVLTAAPHAGIGFIEAHGLALILSILLWRALPQRSWHLTAVAMEVLLGTVNLVFWKVFIDGDALAVGYITTALHGIFVVLQLFAALSSQRIGERGSDLGDMKPYDDRQPFGDIQAPRSFYTRHVERTPVKMRVLRHR